MAFQSRPEQVWDSIWVDPRGAVFHPDSTWGVYTRRLESPPYGRWDALHIVIAGSVSEAEQKVLRDTGACFILRTFPLSKPLRLL